MYGEWDHLVFSTQVHNIIYLQCMEFKLKQKLKNRKKMYTHVELGKYPFTKSSTYIKVQKLVGLDIIVITIWFGI